MDPYAKILGVGDGSENYRGLQCPLNWPILMESSVANDKIHLLKKDLCSQIKKSFLPLKTSVTFCFCASFINHDSVCVVCSLYLSLFPAGRCSLLYPEELQFLPPLTGLPLWTLSGILGDICTCIGLKLNQEPRILSPSEMDVYR